MNTRVTFSGPSPAVNAMTPQGSNGAYFGPSPDFTAVMGAVDSGTYKLSILNYGGITGWPRTFTMTKSDDNPAQVLGSYSLDDGSDGIAIVAPA